MSWVAGAIGVHQPDCRLDCGGTYVCTACERVCGWCFGCADEAPGLCDECYCRLIVEPEELVALTRPRSTEGAVL